eukprot:6186045-Pleurochrysis_carterae.AAC.1
MLKLRGEDASLPLRQASGAAVTTTSPRAIAWRHAILYPPTPPTNRRRARHMAWHGSATTHVAILPNILT